MEFTAQQIANVLNGTVEGNPDVCVDNFSKIDDGKPNTLTFLANPKYEHHIYHTLASIVLVNDDYAPSSPSLPIKATLVRVPNAYMALAKLFDFVEQLKTKKSGIDSTAYIHPTAKVGQNCYVGNFSYIGENAVIGEGSRIYPHCYIGDGVVAGANCAFYPNSVIYDGCVIGNNCIVHAGAVIGSDGFGFASEGEEYRKIPQLGNVVLEDDVEIGANTTVDRAVMDSTIIRKGVKIDNLVQIAHNVEIGQNTAMAAQVGVSGSVKIGKNCRLGGQAGLAGHLRIGDNTSIGAQSGVISDIEGGSTIFGTPALNSKTYMRSYVIYNRLPELYRTVEQLKKEVEQLKKQSN